MSEFHFLRPLWLLALLPWAGLMWRLWRVRRDGGNWLRVCDPELLPSLLEQGRGGTARWTGPLLALAGGLAVIALAGPTWERQPTPVYTVEDGMVILVDLSRSMDSPDLAPNRLTRARYKLADLLQQRRDGLTGLVVFGGEAFLAAPLSDDSATLAYLVEALETRLMPVQGTRLQPALELADELFAGAGIEAGSILLVSDGDGLEAAAEAAVRARPHRMLVLGVGTPSGAPIPVGDGFFKDPQGNIVVPGLAEDRLRALAEAGNGVYRRISADGSDIASLVAASIELAPEGEQTDDRGAEYWREFGPWLLLPLLPLAALGFRRGYLVLLVGLLAPWPRAEALDLELWRNRDQRAYADLQSGRFDAAAETFGDPRWKSTALYRAGRWDEAIAALGELDQADDWYNRGNAMAAAGRHEDAIQAYQAALERDPEHADAAYNLDKLRELQQQQQQQTQAGEGESGEADPSPASEPGEPAGDGENAESDEATDSDPGGERDGQAEESGESADNGEPGAQQGDPGEQEQSGEQSQQGEAGEQATEARSARSGEGESGAGATRHAGRLAADEQWLRRIRENPAELLRRKFLYLSRQRGAEPDEDRPW